MAILEKIRKRTTVLIIIIGLALFSFVISDLFTRGGFQGGKAGSSLGEVNGEAISIDDFRLEMESMESRLGGQLSTTQVVNTVWDQTVRNLLLSQQFEALGIDIGQDQIMEIIRTNPNFTQNPQFLDANGNFDEDAFRNFITDLRVNQPQQYQFWLQNEAALIQTAKEQTYFTLIQSGTAGTLEEGKFDYHLTNDKVDIRYVRLPYTAIPDSTITISKDEMADYIEDNPDRFSQEEARDIRYVYFEEKASEADEEAITSAMLGLLEDKEEYRDDLDSTVVIEGFRNTEDMAAFLDRNSDTRYDTVFRGKNELSPQYADTLSSMPVGAIYGPYRDGNFFRISRMMAKKANGSVKASHILIAYEGALRANPEVTRSKDEAESRAQELLAQARQNNDEFAQLARDNSDGPSAPSGGDLGYFLEGVMTEKFNDFAFQNSVGTIGLVETEFGFHVIKVDDKRDVVRLATLSRAVEPSDETVNTLFTDATKLEMEVTENPQQFAGIAQEKGYEVRPVNKLKAMDENLPGLGAQRRIVQWAFNPDTDVADVRRFDMNNGYALVQLTAKFNKGTRSVEEASVQVLPLLRKKRKAEMMKTANASKSIEDIAKDNNQNISTASALNAKSPTIPGAGREALVVGIAVAMEQGAISGLIEGETGVYKFEVVRKEVAPELDNYAPNARAVTSAIGPRINSAILAALKKKAEIEDNRAFFY
ncbi:SurA N-terminal domain-containing protein [Robiginitalea sp.]|nr:SurA N-terminal domain-containing protein [Robiginitalea sp.]